MDLQVKWIEVTTFIRESKRLHEGVLNALDDLDRLIEREIADLSLRQI